MKVAYRLKDNPEHIARVQKATLTTDDFGIEPTNGLFGSPEWWDRIASGDLPVHTLGGTITERFMGSMGDWPEITVLSDTGEKSHWTREVNRKEQDALYRVGRRIEIDYVLQRHRGKSFAQDQKKEHKVVVEIRVEPDAEGDVPGVYEKLRAKEVAHEVLTAPVLFRLIRSGWRWGSPQANYVPISETSGSSCSVPTRARSPAISSRRSGLRLRCGPFRPSKLARPVQN